jgi:hypothetical protein
MAMMIITMATRENEFEPRLGKPPADQAPKLKGVRAVARQVSPRRQSSGKASASKLRQPSIRAHFAPGSKNRARPAPATSRRVVVKVRYAANAGGKVAALKAHVAYLSREAAGRAQAAAAVREPTLAQDPTQAIDALARGGEAGAPSYDFYDRASSTVDARAVTQGWAGDPRHFRMIISAEDGEALGDLKPFIREVMAGLESKLGTRLEWLAVNHHDTDNPHTHVLIRGRRPDGQELFIPSRLISSGIREHAQEIVTRLLGPRLAPEIAQSRFSDISLRAPTPLDRELLQAARTGPVYPARADLAARLERLEAWDLASRTAEGWRLAPGLVQSLRAMADHDDIARAIAQKLEARPPQVLLGADPTTPVTGELVHYGPADEFTDRFVAVIETGGGVLRYATFGRPQDLAILSDVRPGSFVIFAPTEPALRPSVIAVARIAGQTGGIYSVAAHASLEPYVDRGLMEANIRRLENMRRLGLVEGLGDVAFRVGDHVTAALAFEEKQLRRSPFSAEVASYWSLGDQIEAIGPTHLDRVLAGDAHGPTGEGRVAREFEQALQQRRLFLIGQGVMEPHEPGPSRQMLQRMARFELSTQAAALSEELGLPVLTHDAQRVSGIYARRIDMAQGRVALILAGRHAHLVPWRPPLERFAGREVVGVLGGQGLSWSLQRGRELGLGLG